MNKIGIISTFPPTQCGIATYATDLIQGLKDSNPALTIYRYELTSNLIKNNTSHFIIQAEQAVDYFKASKFINASDIDVLDIQHEFKIFGKPDGENIQILLETVTKPIATTLHTVNFNLPK